MSPTKQGKCQNYSSNDDDDVRGVKAAGPLPVHASRGCPGTVVSDTFTTAKTSRMLNHKEHSDHRRHRYQDAATVPSYVPSNPSPASVAMTQLVSAQPMPGDALRLDFVPGTEKTMMAGWGQIL